MNQNIIIIYLIINLIVFALYGIDKKKAKNHAWRIPESTLLLAAVFGAPGALLGMIFFHHKTRKAKFAVGVPAILIIEIALVLFLRDRIGF